MLLGLPAEGGCLHQALKSCVLMVPFWYSGLELQLGPHLPFLWRDTEGNKVFFWGVIGCLLRNGSLLRVLCSSAPLVATAGARFVDVHSPASTRIPPKSWAGGLSWAECIGMQPEGQRGEEKQAPVSLALWRCLQQAAPAWVQGSSLTKALGCACYKKDLRKDNLHMGLW